MLTSNASTHLCGGCCHQPARPQHRSPHAAQRHQRRPARQIHRAIGIALRGAVAGQVLRGGFQLAGSRRYSHNGQSSAFIMGGNTREQSPHFAKHFSPRFPFSSASKTCNRISFTSPPPCSMVSPVMQCTVNSSTRGHERSRRRFGTGVYAGNTSRAMRTIPVRGRGCMDTLGDCAGRRFNNTRWSAALY